MQTLLVLYGDYPMTIVHLYPPLFQYIFSKNNAFTILPALKMISSVDAALST